MKEEGRSKSGQITQIIAVLFKLWLSQNLGGIRVTF